MPERDVSFIVKIADFANDTYIVSYARTGVDLFDLVRFESPESGKQKKEKTYKDSERSKSCSSGLLILRASHMPVLSSTLYVEVVVACVTLRTIPTTET